LDHAQPLDKVGHHCKPLRSLLDGQRDYFSLFEDPNAKMKDENKQTVFVGGFQTGSGVIMKEKANQKKARLTKEKLVNHLVEQK